jgi:Uma2 family endonuclease
LLAVEVLSHSTRRVDRLLKRDRLQEAGAASYWLLDPGVPAMTVLELRDGRYVEAAVGEGGDQVHV